MPHVIAKPLPSKEENDDNDLRNTAEGSGSTHLTSEANVPEHNVNRYERSITRDGVSVNTVTPTITRDESVKHGANGFNGTSHVSYHHKLSSSSDFVDQGESQEVSRKRQTVEDDQGTYDQTKWEEKHDTTSSNRKSSHLERNRQYSIPYNTPTMQTQSYPNNYQHPWGMQPMSTSTPYSNFPGMIPFTPNQVHQSPYIPAQVSQMDHRHPSMTGHGAIVYQNYYRSSTPMQTENGTRHLPTDKEGESYPSSAKKYKAWNDEKYQGEKSTQEQSNSSLHQDSNYPYDSPYDNSSRRMYVLPSPVHQRRNYRNTTESSSKNPKEETPSHIKQFDNVYNTSPMATTSVAVDLKTSHDSERTEKIAQKEEIATESERIKKTPRRNRKVPQRYIQENSSEDGSESVQKETTHEKKDDRMATRKENVSTDVAPTPQPLCLPTHTIENSIVERIRAQNSSFVENQPNFVCTKLLPSEVAKYQALPQNELMEILSRSKGISLPHFSNMINYMPSKKSRQQSTFRECVMCGLLCPTNFPKKHASTNVTIIPTQNKGLCTNCDVGVWMVNETFTEIKWCKGCKNFRKWIDFGGKLMATKCEACRERQREKYREKCENREKQSMERALMYQKVKHNIRNAKNNDHSGLDCLLAAASTQLEGENGSGDNRKK